MIDLEAEVRRLARPEGRVPGTPGHDRARAYLLERLADLDLEPYSEPGFDLEYRVPDGIVGHNLVGVRPGADRAQPPLLLGAHYDSALMAPCADDNAAAVAVALRVIAGLEAGRLDRDVVLALFDAEEPPHYQTPAMGSIRFHGGQMDERGVHCAVIQDLTGHRVPAPPGLPDAERIERLLFVTGAESHAGLPPVLRPHLGNDSLPLVATVNRNVGDVSDHGIFRRQGHPYLFLTCGRWPHYHRPTDIPERLDYDKMAAVVELIEALLPAIDAAALSDGAPGVDTVSLEVESLRAGLGDLLDPLCGLLGVDDLEGRDDLDAFAAGFRSLAGI